METNLMPPNQHNEHDGNDEPHPEPVGKRKRSSLIEKVKKHPWTVAIWAIFIFSLGGPLNYFSSHPRILYFPAIIFAVVIVWTTHVYVRYLENPSLPDSQSQIAPPAPMNEPGQENNITTNAPVTGVVGPVTNSTVNIGGQHDAEILTILKRMELYKTQNEGELSREFTLGYTLFTMAGTNQVVPFKTDGKMVLTHWEKCGFTVTNEEISLRLPDIKYGGMDFTDFVARIDNRVGAKHLFSLDSKNTTQISGAGAVRGVLNFGSNPEVTLKISVVEVGSYGRMVVMGLKPFALPVW